MQFEDYQCHLTALKYGKRLPTAIYVFRQADTDFGRELNQVLAILETQHELDAKFNVIKFRTDELKVSFLCYPDFLDEAHPALRYAVTIDLVTGKARHTDYGDNHNPPILHRKESFLPEAHPERATFDALTRSEEAEGLYQHPATIGFKLNWERLLNEKGLIIKGHRLERGQHAPSVTTEPEPVIERHKTAMTRYDLSKPVKTLLEYGMLKAGDVFFDYGCGQGSDVRGLQGLGHAAEGWDPVHKPEVKKREADVVNMGYVLNVIENPAERLSALVDAYRYARRLLVVAGLIQETVDSARAEQYSDGILTKRNTFQKFFQQQELQQFIEDALECTAVPVSLGVFYVFRNPTDQQDFLSARSRRTIDWTQISARLGLGSPRTMWKSLYDSHKELLDGFGKVALALGRIPEQMEFARLHEVDQLLGSARRALRAFVQGGAQEDLKWDEIRVRFGIGQPPKRRWEQHYEENRDLLEAYWGLMLQKGRLLEPEEYPQTSELLEKVGSPKQALRIFVNKGGGEEMQRAAESRKRDLLVYVALANLRKRVPFGHLSQGLRFDIREFFGNYTVALEKGVELLFAAGDTGEIELACEDLKVGWQDEQALFFHRSVLDELPPVLRAYVGCATALFGDVSQTDVVKLHKSSGKVTFLGYDDFEGKPLPELRHRIKVNLRTRWVQVFDHSAEGQLLFFKERFLSPNHPSRAEMEAFSTKLRKLGLSDKNMMGPTQAEFTKFCESAALNENLIQLRKQR